MTVDVAAGIMRYNVPVDMFESDKYREAYQIAVEALEKRVPKKPERYYQCPCCDARLKSIRLTDGWGSYITEPNFCPACGQRIDWRDDK